MSPAGQKIVNLISQRYIAPGKQPDHPRRSYGYVKGQLQIYGGQAGAVHNLSGADRGWAAEIAQKSASVLRFNACALVKPDPLIQAWCK